MLPDEADMLANLARQVVGLHRAVIDRRAALDDPVMERLYPSAYGSVEDAAEFRRLAAGDIATARIQTMMRMVVDLETALPAEGDDHDDADVEQDQPQRLFASTIRLGVEQSVGEVAAPNQDRVRDGAEQQQVDHQPPGCRENRMDQRGHDPREQPEHHG